MKVLLINPPTGIYDRADRCQAPIKEEGIEMVRPPMDLTYMAAMVEKAGGKAMIKDYPAESLEFADFENDLIRVGPDILVLSVTTPTMEEDLRCCRIAKKINPQILTVAKGAHFYVFDKEVLRKYPFLDIVIRGEAEMAVFDIARGKSLKNIAGISFREGKLIIRNPSRPFLDNLDKLPFPARHLIHNNLYRFPDTNEPYALVMVGRGCPGRCIFCLVGEVSGKKLRTRSVENVLEEIKLCVEDYQIRTFFFRADTFTWRRSWVVNFCQKLIGLGVKIRWGTNSRVDTLDRELVFLMKKAGCDIIGLGIESGSQEILTKMGKGTSLSEAKLAVNLCQEAGIKTLLFFILGLPWENAKTVRETIDFAKELPGTFYNFSLAYPFPGTKFATLAERYHLLIKDSLFGFDYAKPATRSLFLSCQDLENYRCQALREVYYRPAYVLRILSQARSWREFFNYLRHGFIKTVKLIANESSVD